MNTLRVLLVPMALSTAALASATDFRVVQLDNLVHLAPDQKAKSAEIFRTEEAAVAVAQSSEPKGPVFQLTIDTMRNLRQVLTPDQLAVYDRTPSGQGGGLLMSSPEEMVQALDREVDLTGPQRRVALQVYTEEFESVVALPWESRITKMNQYQRVAEQEIRSLLTPQQLGVQENKTNLMMARLNEESAATEKAVRSSAKLGAKVGSIVYVQRGRRSARYNGSTRSGEAQFKVAGDAGTADVVVYWERSGQTGPVKVTRIVSAQGEPLGP